MLHRIFATFFLLSLLWFAGSRLSIVPSAYAQQATYNVTLQSSKTTVEPDESLVYTVKVQNTGGADGKEVTVRLAVDDDLEIESVSDGGKRRSGAIEWEIDIRSGSTRTLTASTRAESKIKDDDRLFSSVIVGNAFDEVSTLIENEDDENNDNDRNLAVEVISTESHLKPGDSFRYTINVRNNDDRKVRDVTVELELDDHIEFLSAANRGKLKGQRVVWESLDIDGEETRVLTASVRLSKDAGQESVLSSLVFTEGVVHENKIFLHDLSRGVEHIDAFVFADAKTVEAGETLTYTIRVQNAAPVTEFIDLQAIMDEYVTFASASDSGKQYDDRLVQWKNIRLEQNEEQSFSLAVTVDEHATPTRPLQLQVQAGAGRNSVETAVQESVGSGTVAEVASLRSLLQEKLSAPAWQRDNVNPLRDTEIPQPLLEDNVLLIVERDKQEFQPGSVVQSTITVRNTGNTELQHVLVEESFPGGTLTVTQDGGALVSRESLQWLVESVPSGQTWERTYTAKTSQNLQHGMTVHISTQLSGSDGVVAKQETQALAVIEKLPEAGWRYAHPLQPEVAHASSPVHPVDIAAGRVQRTQTMSVQKISFIAWIATVLLGLGLGMTTAARLPRR